MKIIGMQSVVDHEGRIILPAEATGAAGLKPGDAVNVTLAMPGESDRPLLAITPEGIGITIPLPWPGDTKDGDGIQVPNELLEDAVIPLDSELEIICGKGEIIIRPADPLELLPDDLRGLFEDLGVNPETVRRVMEEEGYVV
ncbi:hypothetical protein [Desulfitobacterium hafniense]|uniref:hypothetical protein n=1 Tax=Desulfitobacterium hafniense TaxID=49338 RepID=UPI00037415FC|nr:hypothetical protein [Desulfitobacterium hafniense]